MTNEVFISYSRKDLTAATLVKRSLEDCQITCFLDVDSIAGSEHWMEILAKGINGCEVVVLLLSSHALGSRFVHNEHVLALEKGRKLVPVFLENGLRISGGLEFALAGIQRISARPNLEAVMPQITDAVRRQLDQARHAQCYADAADNDASANWTKTLRLAVDDCGLPTAKHERGKWEFTASAFVIETLPEMYLGAALGRLPRLGDPSIEVTLEKLDGPDDSWFGIEFGKLWPGSYYQCLLDGTGGVRLCAHLGDGVWRDLAVQRCRGLYLAAGRNTLRLVRHHRAIHVFLNGLFALTCDDDRIHFGEIGLVAGPRLRVAFTAMQVAGTELGALFRKSDAHWERLEIRDARKHLRSIVAFEPEARHPTEGWPAKLRLAEVRPDLSETVLIVVGSGLQAQVNDGAIAAGLREEIDRRGNGDELRRAFVVGDEALLSDEVFQRCPLIAVGGPATNRWTARISDKLQTVAGTEEGVFIQHANDWSGRRVALWGDTVMTTRVAVEQFVKRGFLGSFLASIWSHD